MLSKRRSSTFEEAIKSDPRFALAYSGLADTYVVLVDHGYVPRSEGLPKGQRSGEKGA